MTRDDFSKIYWISRNIARWERALEEIETASMRSPSDIKPTVAYGTNQVSDNVARDAQRCVEIRKRIERLRNAARQKEAEMYDYIDKISLEEPYMAAVIEERCIKCKTWEGVADTLGGSGGSHKLAFWRYMKKRFPA
jgi:hypothetical protein